MACQFCGDESVPHGIALTGNELALLVAEVEHGSYMTHLRLAHPAEYAREHASELEMNAALAGIFGERRQR